MYNSEFTEHHIKLIVMLNTYIYIIHM